MATTDEQNMPFIRNLASSDRKTRTSALTTLRTFLSSAARPRTPLDDLKLWKGLFFSLWMCDRAVPQQNLCAELAALTTAAPGDAAVAPWLAAFWATVAREWTSIDVLRLEKFLLLVRRVFAAGLEWAFRGGSGKRQGKKWDTKARRDALLDLFREWPLETAGDLAKMPVGLRLHVLDIWVDELAKIGYLGEQHKQKQGQGQEESEDEEEEAESAIDEEDEAFLNQLRELVEAQLKSPSKPVRVRARDSLADERLPWNKGKAGDDGEESSDGEDAWGGFRD
ncbi:hypothetical protein SLS62_000658 [Diatrype stigma]|uniref:Ribosomal RNA-processing protein 1 n=1 Tax=Diatrype stigma TaxID=117547 RepID=A0AAN9V0W4_9PEZI